MGNGSKLPRCLHPGRRWLSQRQAEPIHRRPAPPARLLTALGIAASLLATTAGSSAERQAGIIIYTTLDNGRDETAIAVPFLKADQHALVTNVTTPEGRSIRVTNNMLKEIVRPPDLSRISVVDEEGFQSLKSRAGKLRELQRRFPRAAGSLEGIAGEIERTLQVLEGGNVLFEGRVIRRSDYDRQVSAARGWSIDIEIKGRLYTGARLRSVAEGKVSISHAGGVASIPLESLDEDAITRLNGTATGPLIEKPTLPPPAAPPVAALPGPAGAIASDAVDPSRPPATPSSALLTNPAPEMTSPQPPSENGPAQPAPPTSPPAQPGSPIRLDALRTALRECERQVDIQLEGHSAMADLKTFPGGRYGAMKFDEAMRESRIQQALLDSAVSEQEALRSNLARIGNSSPDDSRVPDALRQRLHHLATLSADTVEGFTGILWLDGELSAILAELDRVAPEEPAPAAEPAPSPAGSSSSSALLPPPATPPVLTLPGRGLPPLPFMVAGLLAFAATAGAVLFQRHRKRIAASSCPRCRSRADLRDLTAGAPVTCAVCGHHYVTRKQASPPAPGPLVYGGVAAGSLLLLASLLILVERASSVPADHSNYVLSDYPAELQAVRQQAESGDPAAQSELGRFHERGTETVPADPREAALWFLSAAEGGDASAQLAIGTLYEMGRGIRPDPRQAERWLTAAAEQGLVEAQKFLGVLYLGKGSLPYDPDRSIEWMTRAAEQGDGEAMFHLSVTYQRGVEVAPDPVKAGHWLQRANDADYGPAQEIRRLQMARMEAEADEMWRESEPVSPVFQGGSPFSIPGPSTYVPPQFEEARRRVEELSREHR